MKRVIHAAVGTVVCGLLTMLGQNAGAANATLPAYETFEAYNIAPIEGQPGSAWSAFAGGGGSVIDTGAYLGVKALRASNVVYTIQDTASSNVWCMMRTKPTMFNQELPAVGASIAAFCMSNAGGRAQIYAADGGAWKAVGPTVSSSGWIGVALKLNYGTKEYDIYAATNATSDEFERLNTSSLNMSGAGDKLTNFVVEGKSFSLDNLVLARARKASGMSNVVVVANNFSAGVVQPLALFPYAYTTNENTLHINKELGADLCMWLTNQYDTLDVYVPGITIPLNFIRQPGAASGWDPSGIDDPSTTHIVPGMGVNLERPSTGPVAMFFDYDSRTVFSGAEMNVVGTNSNAGYNYLVFPSPAASYPIGGGSGGNALGFQDIAKQGDRLYYDGKAYYFNTNPPPSGWWRGGSRATTQIPAGAAFWYRRGDANGAPWDAANAQ